MKKIALRILALVSLLAAAGAFLGWLPAQVLKIQPAPTIAFVVVLLLTPFAGRFFCGWICPLGVLQSTMNYLCHPQAHVRRVCTRLPETKLQLAVRWSVFAGAAVLVAAGAGALAYALTPYSIAGKALAGFVPGLVILAVIIVLSALGKGRLWCNWICPVGTLFSAISRFAANGHKIDLKDGCGNCRACFVGRDAVADEENKSAVPAKGVERREVLLAAGALAVVETMEKTVDGGYAKVSLPGLPERPASVLPPGAVDRAWFNRLCIGCGACAAACPEKCIVLSTSMKTFGQPQLDFRHGHCRVACPQRCAAACPAGALKVRENIARRDLHLGHAIWKKERCIRTINGVACTACSRKCPVGAIEIVQGFPVVDKDKCIGCGACEHVCPARPLPAIFVKGFDRQRAVRPFNLDDLIAEMKGIIVRGEASAVAACDGVICARASGRGLEPLLTLLDGGKLRRAVVVDKVVGRAAAAVCIAGRVRRVHALMMSEDARTLLSARGIPASADEMVPKILDRQKRASCPLETRIEGIEDPERMVEALRAMIAR